MFEILHQKTTATADFIESVRFIVPRFELKLTFFSKLFIDTSHVCIFFYYIQIYHFSVRLCFFQLDSDAAFRMCYSRCDTGWIIEYRGFFKKVFNFGFLARISCLFTCVSRNDTQFWKWTLIQTVQWDSVIIQSLSDNKNLAVLTDWPLFKAFFTQGNDWTCLGQNKVALITRCP